MQGQLARSKHAGQKGTLRGCMHVQHSSSRCLPSTNNRTLAKRTPLEAACMSSTQAQGACPVPTIAGQMLSLRTWTVV
eukprot:1141380-Pelagomonas_calceolata.AAC.7